ncbi:hypothetical protein [Dyadobacter sp. CY326]|uniref:hypothetical protein n=1 Tax=Dyadobacter sp. CY326 TaxID=2907300 RepID=UPI001F43E3FB|nr:hypothetical protein [Dyadobacter sp. CY326]MCE7065747.1 hypothetical protein [Dyadobacter sp. CY326]
MKRLLFLLFIALVAFTKAEDFVDLEQIPITWDLERIKLFHLPPPDTSVKVVYAPKAYYDSLPEHIIYKTYPVFVRENEKQGYLDSLRNVEPEIVFDPRKLKTKEDWIKAGEIVFNWPVSYRPDTGHNSTIDSAYINATKARVTPDGLYPYNRYVVSEKGKVLWGSLSCASCHTTVTKSGQMIAGGQGTGAGDRGFAHTIETRKIPLAQLQGIMQVLSYTPWAPKDLPTRPATSDEYLQSLKATPPGVITRQGLAYLYPLTIPSLIGIKDIKYLDHTGLMRNEGPGDLMRYAAFNQGLDMLTSYNGFIPGHTGTSNSFPALSQWKHPFGYAARKYSDAQLYALTQYLYSLKEPKNPYDFPVSQLEQGRMVFKQAGCATCHAPPLYTNNKLTPANGFIPPKSHLGIYDIFNVSVKTDSVSTLYSRRGTGYYKVPSLRGVWHRSAFFHNGNLTTLEEVLDPKRLDPQFVPSGYKPPHLKSMAVRGHTFGLNLKREDKDALIAFLKSL